MTLFNAYEIQNLVYKKYNNRSFNTRNSKMYFASVFSEEIPNVKLEK
jgi:hypothetical protein